jgi:diguanylate cyclase (GGDEF)-like protein
MKYFWNSLQFRVSALFIVFFLLILAAIFGVLSTVGKPLLEKQAHEQVILAGQNIVSELGRRIALAESLATSLANLGEQLLPDDEVNKELTEHILNYEGTESFIAGGGLWPAPYQYDPKVERRSFFWGRDSQGVLKYYDDYNDPSGPGYHHEEWYVPAKHLQEGEAFWSKSYMDPYSYQPMVTVTVPMYRRQAFYGVSTVDLKLEGLHAFLDEVSSSFGGYAFAVDRNGKFLSFPEESLTKVFGTDDQGGRTEEFIGITELAAKQPRFEPLAVAVQKAIDRIVSNAAQAGFYREELAETIAEDSYQIELHEARLITAVLADLQRGTEPVEPQIQQVHLEDDLLLGEPAFAAVFEMPQTYWKIVTVMPYSQATATSDVIYKNLASYTVIAVLVSLAAVLFLVRRILVRPVTRMSEQLQLLSEATDAEHKLLEVSDRSELGELAYWFNQRSRKLYEVQNKLRDAHERLENRVIERTEELRQEIEKRKAEQAVKESQAARVNRQHAAIVKLSQHDSLYHGDIDRAAKMINETAAEVTDVGRTSIWLIDDERVRMKAVDLYDKDSDRHLVAEPLYIQDSPAYFEAIARDRSIAVSEIQEDQRTIELRDYALAHGISSLLDSPIRVGGKLRGVVCFEHTGEKREWQDDEIRFSGEIADQFLQVLTNAERIKSEEQIRRLAFYDPLTGLPNRRLLLEGIQHELEVVRRQRLYGSLLFLDLDNFKTLNDSLGHHVGDELLVQLAERLRSGLRKEDTAARLGGDEFVVLITGEYAGREMAIRQALNVARKIQLAIGGNYHLQGYEHTITSSIGITLFPERNETAADVLKQADTAMYRAKEEGRNTIAFYNPEMQKEADRRLSLEKELRASIAEKRFEIFFQPQLDSDGALAGAEALVRWLHPDKGMVLPADFIPVAEETGLILELGEWILRETCACIRGCSVSHVAVNISPRQFRQADFVEKVIEILQETGTNPRELMIELTEGIVIANIEDTIDKMNALKKMGIRIAIDDFGTGYSSLAYLKQLPLDQLKINDKFVRDIETDPSDAVIVETIISMARHLGLSVVAEGVETADQFAFLEDKGCHMFQGFYFSRPLTRDDFTEYRRSLLTT